MTNSTVTTLVGIPFIIINIVVIYLIAGPVALVVMIICGITLTHSVFFYYRVTRLSPKNKDNQIAKTSIYLEALANLETLKSIGNYDFFTKNGIRANEYSREISLRMKTSLQTQTQSIHFSNHFHRLRWSQLVPISLSRVRLPQVH